MYAFDFYIVALDFLTDRQARVSVNGAYSDWAKVTSSVAQGSVLGPLLFLLYVNDIPASFIFKIKPIADDTKIWNTIKTQSNSQSLQLDLDLLSKLSDEWLLRFHIDKCHVMHTERKSKAKYYLEKDNKRLG